MQKQAVLMFHGVGTPPSSIPSEEIPYWIPQDFFKEIVAFVEERPNVILTFDDGNASDCTAAEMLASAGLHGKFYVLTGRLDRAGYLNRSDLRALHDMGMEVGLHGANHVDWRKIGMEELREETVRPSAVISDVIGAPVTSLAIPFGAYNKRVIRYLEELDFERIYTSDRGLALASQRFVRRNPVMSWHSIRDIEDIVNDRVSLPARVRRSIMPYIKRQIGWPS